MAIVSLLAQIAALTISNAGFAYRHDILTLLDLNIELMLYHLLLQLECRLLFIGLSLSFQFMSFSKFQVILLTIFISQC